MMKSKLLGIYGKVFFYTMLILFVVLCVLFLFFSNQIKSIELSAQQQQLAEIFKPFFTGLSGKTEEEIIEITKEFHEKNAAFEFRVESPDGNVLFQTDNFIPPDFNFTDKTIRLDTGDMNPSTNGLFKVIGGDKNLKKQFISIVNGGYRLYISNIRVGANISSKFIKKLLLAFLILFSASAGVATLFARRIAKPVQHITEDARRMSNLEDVSEPEPRNDEIGQLAGDVYKMYENLKNTIRQLELEIEREREMEENQRYFYAAASHELKTPIAAVSALLEGMLEEVMEPSEYPGCMRECLKIMNEQNKLVSDILELVTFNTLAMSKTSERVNLNSWVVDVFSSCKVIAEAKSQNVRINISEKINCLMQSKLLARAFANILINAVQNTREGGEIDIYTTAKKESVTLGVLNKDSRIPDDILPKLFEPFYREDKARSRNGRSGLGLTIVKKILDSLEIPFSLKNTDSGVLFEMALPRS